MLRRPRLRPGQQIDTFYTVFVIGDPSNLVVRSPSNSDLEGQLQEKTEVSLRLAKDTSSVYPVKYLPNFLVTTTTDQSVEASPISTDYLYFTLPKELPPDQAQIGRQVYMNVILGKKDNVLLLPPAAAPEALSM